MKPSKMRLSNGRREYINWRYVRSMFRNGKDTAFIAEAYGVSEARIYNGLASGKGIHKPNPDFRSPSPHFNIVRAI